MNFAENDEQSREFEAFRQFQMMRSQSNNNSNNAYPKSKYNNNNGNGQNGYPVPLSSIKFDHEPQGAITNDMLYKLSKGKTVLQYKLCHPCHNHYMTDKEKFERIGDGVLMKVYFCNSCVQLNCAVTDLLAPPYKKAGTKRSYESAFWRKWGGFDIIILIKTLLFYYHYSLILLFIHSFIYG